MKKSRLAHLVIWPVVIAAAILVGIYIVKSCGPFETRLIAEAQHSVDVLVQPDSVDELLGVLASFSNANSFDYATPFAAPEAGRYQIEMTRGDANIIGGNTFERTDFQFAFYGPVRLCTWGPDPISDEDLKALVEDFKSVVVGIPGVSLKPVEPDADPSSE